MEESNNYLVPSKSENIHRKGDHWPKYKIRAYYGPLIVLGAGDMVFKTGQLLTEIKLARKNK